MKKIQVSFSLLFLVSALGLVSGCKKKEKLSTNTYQLMVAPSATTVALNNPRTFTAQGISSGGAFAIEPVWQVLESSAGAIITPSVGSSVSVTFPTLGVYTLVADFDDRRGVAQIRVVTSSGTATAPPLGSLSIYNDGGIPAGANLLTNLGTSLAEQTGTFDAPEGFNYMRAFNMTAGFWMVDLNPSSVNLSDFPGGTLKFSVRFSRPLTVGEVFLMQMEQPGGAKATAGTNTGSWGGFDPSITDWQSISINLSLFFGGAGAVRSPFIISRNGGAAVTVDVDNVRWEKN